MSYSFTTTLVAKGGTYAIHWDGEAKAVLCASSGFAQGDAFRASWDTGLKLLTDKKTSKWLADLREQGPVTPHDKKWFAEDWLARASREGLERIAIVQPKAELASMSVETMMSGAKAVGLTAQFFDNPDKARSWLR